MLERTNVQTCGCKHQEQAASTDRRTWTRSNENQWNAPVHAPEYRVQCRQELNLCEARPQWWSLCFWPALMTDCRARNKQSVCSIPSKHQSPQVRLDLDSLHEHHTGQQSPAIGVAGNWSCLVCHPAISAMAHEQCSMQRTSVRHV